MRQAASGFALGSLVISLLIAPFMMVTMNDAPDYTTALAYVIERSGIVEPVLQASAEVGQLRAELMQPYKHYMETGLFPHIPQLGRTNY